MLRDLSRAAAEMGISRILSELGETEHIAADPLADVPVVMPVTKAKVCVPASPHIRVNLLMHLASSQVIVAEGGVEGDVANQDVVHVVPFNLDNLRKHLAEVSYARRILSDDVAARQKILEESVYDVAKDRWKHEAEKMADLGLDTSGLRQAVLQAWMYEWSEKLKEILKSEIPRLQEKETEKGEYCASLLVRMHLTSR